MLRRLRLALALAVGAPVLAGVVVGLVRLAGLDVPHLGWAQSIASDAKAIAHGTLPYADPRESYAGLLYTPGFPLVLAPLYRLRWWDGWPIVLDTLSALGLAGLAGVLATGGRRTARAGLEAIAVAGTSWWLVSSNTQSMLRAGRADHVAWLLALGGLCALARAVRREEPTWPAVALLSGAVWMKQTTVGAMVCAVVVLAGWVALGTVQWRTWWRFVAGVVAANATILGALLLLTRGWLWHFVVTLPGRHADAGALLPYPGEIARVIGAPIVVLAITALPLTVGTLRRRDIREVLARRDLVVLLATILGAFVLVDIVPAWLARRKQGGAANQYVGIAWALCFLVALAWRTAHRRQTRIVAGTVAYAVLAAIVWVPPLRAAFEHDGVTPPSAFDARVPSELRDDIVDYAEAHSVYLPEYGIVGRSAQQWPVQPAVVDLLAAGDRPQRLVDALVDRRFDAVLPFRVDEYELGYVGLSGRTSGDYLLTLNLVIDAGYSTASNGAPASLLGRRPGDVDLAWMRDCFEPTKLDACRARVERDRR